MIKLLDETCQEIQTFKTDVGLYHYLRECWKNLDEAEKQKWNFSRYSYKLLAPFVQEMEGKSFVDMAHQACQREEDLIVICTGDGENPSLYLDTPDLDINGLFNKWSQPFCKAHKMIILRQ